MAANEKTIYVYDDFSFEKPKFIGTLYVNVVKGSESYSFAYDDQWLKGTNLSGKNTQRAGRSSNASGGTFPIAEKGRRDHKAACS